MGRQLTRQEQELARVMNPAFRLTLRDLLERTEQPLPRLTRLFPDYFLRTGRTPDRNPTFSIVYQWKSAPALAHHLYLQALLAVDPQHLQPSHRLGSRNYLGSINDVVNGILGYTIELYPVGRQGLLTRSIAIALPHLSEHLEIYNMRAHGKEYEHITSRLTNIGRAVQAQDTDKLAQLAERWS